MEQAIDILKRSSLEVELAAKEKEVGFDWMTNIINLNSKELNED